MVQIYILWKYISVCMSLNSVNKIFDRPISGTSINQARSIGPAIVLNRYKGLSGAWAYNIIRFTIISQMHCQWYVTDFFSIELYKIDVHRALSLQIQLFTNVFHHHEHLGRRFYSYCSLIITFTMWSFSTRYIVS